MTSRHKVPRNFLDIVGYETGRVSVSFEVFKWLVADWKVYPIWSNDGSLMGVLYNKGPEVHTGILPAHQKRWFSKRVGKELYAPILKRYGYLTTKVPTDLKWAHSLMKRFGFYETGKEPGVITYRLEEFKWL